MKKRCALLLISALLLVTTGCHHFHGFRHPHGMPPGQAKKVMKVKKVVAPGKVKVGRPARPWR